MSSLNFSSGNYMIDTEEFAEQLTPEWRLNAVVDDFFSDPSCEQTNTFLQAAAANDDFLDALLALSAFDLDRVSGKEYLRSAERVTQLAQEIARDLAARNEL